MKKERGKKQKSNPYLSPSRSLTIHSRRSLESQRRCGSTAGGACHHVEAGGRRSSSPSPAPLVLRISGAAPPSHRWRTASPIGLLAPSSTARPTTTGCPAVPLRFGCARFAAIWHLWPGSVSYNMAAAYIFYGKRLIAMDVVPRCRWSKKFFTTRHAIYCDSSFYRMNQSRLD
jgi:hypothetical protein